jgi:predicted nucleic acid-binding protein
VARVYIETSFFSACVSTKTSEKSIGWRASSNEWWETQRHYHELFISGEVIAELSDPEFIHSERALNKLEGLTVLDITAEVEQFAELLVKEKVMPGPSLSGDAVHVATATLHRVDYILSWNVKHLANEKKRTHLAVICMRAGLIPTIIVTPDML